MRTMFDSTTAADIPADAKMVAGYIDGWYQWGDADWARFPNAVKVRIAVHATTDAGHVLDVEWGAAAPEDVPGWVAKRRGAGADPSVYVNRSNWQACRDACVSAGVAEPHWWLASYDNDPTLPEGCVAKQYANEPLTGGHYDASSVADRWPGVDDLTADEIKALIDKRLADLGYPETFAAIKERLAIDAHHKHGMALTGETSEPEVTKKQ